jgi:hypothetical protein
LRNGAGKQKIAVGSSDVKGAIQQKRASVSKQLYFLDKS